MSEMQELKRELEGLKYAVRRFFDASDSYEDDVNVRHDSETNRGALKYAEQRLRKLVDR